MIDRDLASDSAAARNDETESAIVDERLLQELFALQRAILSDIALGLDFAPVMQKLCGLIEAMVPGSLASVMTVDPEDGLLYVAAGPSFPPAAAARFNGLRPREGYGSCGSAVDCGQPVYVSDAWTDKRWRQLQGVAREFGIRACWSYPIRAASGETGGSFAITSFTQLNPTPFHIRLLEDASYLAGIALQKRDQQQALRHSERRLRQWATAFENTSEGVIITDRQGHIIDVNRAFSQITGYSREEVHGQTPSLLGSGRHGEEYYQGMWAALHSQGQWQGEIWNRRKNGEVYPEWLSISRIESDGNTQYVGVFADLSSIKEAEDQLRHLAHHDPLTGLPNRLLFSARLEHALELAERYGHQVAVMFLDLDRFKTINDTLGHGVGDLLIRDVAQRLRQAARNEDTVARQGGDEFTLVLENLQSSQEGALIARKLLEVLKQPFQLANREVHVSASIGISLFPRDGRDGDSLLKHADAAMYQAKARGRNGYAEYTPALSSMVEERFSLESGLRGALRHEQLSLHYQPQVDSRSGRILGAEALLRWQHPVLGKVAPNRFIPIAEETGLIESIGEWVIVQACRQARRWRDAGHCGLRISVNLSGVQIIGSGLHERLRAILRENGLPAGALELEITESFAMEHAEEAIAELEAIRTVGVSLAIDDFGTGYSSLAHLKRLPIDKLKIDQSLVRDIPADPNDEAIARAVVALGHSLGLSVIAEGVETEVQREVLLGTGCDQFQGYLYGRPLPAKAFTALLDSNSALRG